MAVDQNSIHKELRPLNPSADPRLFSPPSRAHQPRPAADPPDDLSEDNPSAHKVKFLCSFGGRILPRPSDGALRYAGGQTRIISVRRDAALRDVMLKMSDAYGGPVSLRYQLPDVDLDALVSVSSPEDLENMMEEYDKLAEESPDGSAKLRVFLFSPSDFAEASTQIELSDSGQRYIDAVNGISEGGLLKRRDSLASASTQNSDGGADAFVDAINEGTLPPILSPTAVTSHDQARLLFMDAPPHAVAFLDSSLLPVNPQVVGSNVPAQPLNAPRQEPPPATPYGLPQAYTDPNQIRYMSHHSMAIPAGSLPANLVSVPQHSYTPPVINSAAPVVSQAGSLRPIQTRVDAHLDDNLYGGRAAHMYSDTSYMTYQPPAQLLPLPSALLQRQNVDHPALRSVPLQPQQQGLTLRSEDCYMCQKALPHAHSDTLIQGQMNGMRGTTPEVTAAFHSLHSEDVMKQRAQNRVVSGGMPESIMEPKTESTASTRQLEAYRFGHIQVDNERLLLSNAGSSEHGMILHPPSVVGLQGDTQASYTMFANLPQTRCEDSFSQQQQHQLPQSSGPTHFPVKQDVIANPYSGDVYSAKNMNIHALEPLNQESLLESSYDYTRAIDGMMEGLHVSQLENPGFSEMLKPSVPSNVGVPRELKPENRPLVLENSHALRSHVGGNSVFVGNAFINPGIIPEEHIGRLSDQLPPPSLSFNQLHNLQAVLPSKVSTSGASLIDQEIGAEPVVPNELSHSGTDAHYGTSSLNKIPIGDLKDEASMFQPKDLHSGMSSSPSADISVPLVNMEQFPEPVSSDSLFCNQDPRKILGNTHMLPPRPVRVPSRESIIPKDLSAETAKSKASDISVLLGEGIFYQPASTYLEPSVRSTGGSAEEQIKQELQAVAEGVAASVLQSSVPPVPVFISRETRDPFPSNKGSVDIEDSPGSQSAAVLGDHKIEDIKSKQTDRMNIGFPIDDIGRLQIIKNSDLEELRELGSGTFGTVYHGKWRGSDVAIKRINDRCFAGKPSEQERMRADFWNEACKLADLHHPNVVAFYGVVLDGPGGSIATVTEYMVNGSLRRVLQKNDKTLDRRKRLLIAMDVAFGMEYLHGKNIVHFDLKSDNLLVNLRDPQRPICKVGDLGLSKVKCQTLISGGVRGTLPWMAPELLNGSSSLVSEKVDVFSFGIVLWELLTGEEPYADLHYGAIIGGIVNNTLRPPVPESCDPEWRSLMEKCWSSEPLERPSFTEIASQLRHLAGSLPVKGRNPEQPPVQSHAQK